MRNKYFLEGLFLGMLITFAEVGAAYHILKATGGLDNELVQGIFLALVACTGLTYMAFRLGNNNGRLLKR